MNSTQKTATITINYNIGKPTWPEESWAICRIIAGCLGFLSNTVQIVLIRRRRDKGTLFTITLLSLCIADVLASIMISAMAISYLLLSLNIAFAHSHWLNVIGNVGTYFSTGTSGLHILFIGIQRSKGSAQ